MKVPEDTENYNLTRAKPRTRNFLKATASVQIRGHWYGPVTGKLQGQCKGESHIPVGFISEKVSRLSCQISKEKPSPGDDKGSILKQAITLHSLFSQKELLNQNLTFWDLGRCLERARFVGLGGITLRDTTQMLRAKGKLGPHSKSSTLRFTTTLPSHFLELFHGRRLFGVQ